MSTKNETVVSQDDTQCKKPYYNSLNLPPKPGFCSKKPSKVQESPLDAKSPQDVLKQNGMYKDESAYARNPEKIFADLSSFGDYESNLNALSNMKQKFSNLDIEVRARFNHNVEEFANYVNSIDFNIEKVLTSDELKKYNKYKTDEENRKKYQQYLNSDEYKTEMQERAQRQAYEQARYEEWLSSQQKGIK